MERHRFERTRGEGGLVSEGGEKTVVIDATCLGAQRKAWGPAGGNGGPGDRRGRLIGRTKGGLHAVTGARGRPLRFLVTAGRVSGCAGAAALPGSPPAPERQIADRGHDADWLRDALKDKGIGPCNPEGSRAARPSDTTGAAPGGATGSRPCSAG